MRRLTRTIAILWGCGALALLPSGATAQFNNPPTPGNDSISLKACQEKLLNLTANDTDPEGNYPLTVTSVGQIANAYIEIVSASSVMIYANDMPGGGTVEYTVQDSLGATATGLISIGVFARVCP